MRVKDILVVRRALMEAAWVRLPQGMVMRAANRCERPVTGPAPSTECDSAEGGIMVEADADSVVVGAGAYMTSSFSHRQPKWCCSLALRRGSSQCFTNIISYPAVPRQDHALKGTTIKPAAGNSRFAGLGGIGIQSREAAASWRPRRLAVPLRAWSFSLTTFRPLWYTRPQRNTAFSRTVLS